MTGAFSVLEVLGGLLFGTALFGGSAAGVAVSGVLGNLSLTKLFISSIDKA
ncbi:hypothetical protein H6S82_30865 [Planktothrix sp. FACHB-1355]|uniref:Uncharacterized protein n=1 Tax=Aerosakkonema funiforme FACHB-1375 TaxID=2949571 RepID=A0A926VD83_9CYAN|nr:MULTISPECIES: hypothetical protein [Oscillatoriales]MBD2181380.1 hypothetical protein [Aerosakkonema funiforme FACHB-1375]MBD3563207.1 hypothetical protein [Planktothrix sp. FACHB-1355]